MNTQTIGEHTICPDLLTGGIAIDAGCLGFGFSLGMQELGCKVLAFDIQPMEAPVGIEFRQAAIWSHDCVLKYRKMTDKQAAHISGYGEDIAAISLDTIYKDHPNIDILKLDCEGSEYIILADFKPIPRMLSVEFHLHCHKELHDQFYVQCIQNIEKYYRIIQNPFEPRYGCVANYWDLLAIRRDLLC